ncbi:MAG TPA: nickel pincer cofactor biosynthesis protein LarB [bacterium]|nr:nickel pincer cofactor biosynthesis protein LarB [bacterium]
MNRKALESLLKSVQSNDITIEDALQRLRNLPYEDLEFVKIDHHRALRQGYPEVVFCPGKTVEQAREIITRLWDSGSDVLATRGSEELFHLVQSIVPQAQFHHLSKAIVLQHEPSHELRPGPILVVCAGTSDLPVAEEAAVTAKAMGNEVQMLTDVGVAGIHRLLNHRDLLWAATVVIVVAGMEGALASVVGGLVNIPVIAVPTSIGYGASFNGLAALLAMLNSCAAGVTVVNIDNGFGAGFAASQINRLRERPVKGRC